MGNSHDQPRQPKGQPTGGQFGNKQHSDDEISRLRSPQTVAETAVTAEELFRLTQTSAKYWMGHANSQGDWYEADDIAQEAAVAFLMFAGNREDKSPEETAAYIHRCAATAMSREGFYRAEDQRALRALRAWQADFENTHERRPTSHETAEAAKLIRANWPDQKHLPGKDFHLAGTILSDPSQVLELRTSTLGQPEASALGEVVDGFDEDSLSAKILMSANRVDTGDGAPTSRSATRLTHAWDALAEHSGVAPVKAGSISRERSSEITATVAQAGGANKIATDWLNGDIAEDAPEVLAMFAPFGVTRAAEQSDVAETLSRLGTKANDIWDGAARKSNKRYAQRTREFEAGTSR